MNKRRLAGLMAGVVALLGVPQGPAAADIPAEGVVLDGVALEWAGNVEMQSAPPFGGSNYFSAGASAGDQATYRAVDDDVSIVHVAADGTRSRAAYATRTRQVGGSVQQLVRFDEGRAELAADGAGTVTWEGDWSVNFYGGLVPFTFSDPVLTVAADGTGELLADMSGYASSMTDPDDREPMDPVADVTVATFTGASIDPDGRITITPDYAGRRVTVPEDQTPQVTTGSGWGAWPQEFLDFHFASGLSSYWYSSGGAADAKKPPLPLAVDFTGSDPVVTEPTPEPTPTPTPTPTPSAPADPDTGTEGALVVKNAALRWGLNNESNNAAFAPGTYNFFSAGKIANPGKGGTILKQSSWQQRSGNVRIEKYSADASDYQAATWAGLSTDSSGAKLTTSGGRFSNHQVVLTGGTGRIDPSTGSGSVRWKGSFTVLYYSGMTFFYVTDPALTVSNGTATLAATLSGYASSQTDTTQWVPVAPRKVNLAKLGKVDLSGARGFTATPAYRGVKVNVPSSATAQVRTGSSWGSFPQSFVDYQNAAGSGSYWYSSGGASDAHKIALPVSISYDAARPVTTTTPAAGDDSGGGGIGTVSNPIVTEPANASPAPAASPAALPALVAATTAFPAFAGPVDTLMGLGTQLTSGVLAWRTSWPWWLGTAALLGAVVIVVRTLRPRHG